ncbi:hypothetical protein BDW74DRAFT_146225 [Aspergillus multicolor]|uniref:uncharacterized protein n=1 Tax=Aspergillus multicolor TaxID=41759 RepID=UPI003CCCD12A
MDMDRGRRHDRCLRETRLLSWTLLCINYPASALPILGLGAIQAVVAYARMARDDLSSVNSFRNQCQID